MRTQKVFNFLEMRIEIDIFVRKLKKHIKIGGSKFSSYEIELPNRDMQNDITLQVTNLEIFLRNSSFELLTRFNKILN